MLNIGKFNKLFKIAGVFLITLLAVFLLANFVLAADAPEVGLDYVAGTGLSNAVDIRIIIAKIIRIVLGFLGIIAVSLIIYAGFLWMTSEGEEEKVEQAKKTLTNAVIGLIIILSAFAIVSFILNMLVSGSSGQTNKTGGGTTKSYGLSALGNGIIESHYPEVNQKEVPRNTSIIITFREPILATTLCATTDTAAAAQCKGEAINKDVARIFKQSEDALCITGYATTPAACTSLADAKVYSSIDGKIYVFVPNSYLGSPSEYINYTVYLGSGLKKQSGDLAFPGLDKDYGWSFEVSNKIDLTPPQVKKNGVFPSPDNLRDTIMSVSDSAQATGKITVNSEPSINQDAKVTSVTGQGVSPTASVKINKDCQQDGAFSIAIAQGPIAYLYKNSIKLGQGTFGSSSDGNKQIVFDECNLTLILSDTAANFADGNLWDLVLSKVAAADTITVGGITYAASSVAGSNNFVVGLTDSATAQNIANALANNPDVTASALAKVVTVKAKMSGVVGNSINLSSSNSSTLEISAMAGGTDKEDQVVVNGKKDQPMNAAIQINFNEAIMPLTVSGTSDNLKDFIRVVNADAAAKSKDATCAADSECKSFSCDNGICVGDNEYLKGKFAISNQYSTVEFLSDKECGFNACGEKIYCLPANSNLRVDINAASLISCTADSDCQAYVPFNICDVSRKFCRDSENKYYPQAAKDKPNIVDGVIDAAFNSLDGNRDGSAYGPASFYNENTPLIIGSGDSYQWSFFITNKLDLTPPKIKTTTPVIAEAKADLLEAIKIGFDKLMLSSRLTTGSLIIQNGKQDIRHYLLNLSSSLDQPLGYWATNVALVGATGDLESTDAFINHTEFTKASSYKAQAGSGIKDIYQNCYLPCSSITNPGGPSCCNGAAYNQATCP